MARLLCEPLTVTVDLVVTERNGELDNGRYDAVLAVEEKYRYF
jgi:hypothetical protein